MTRRRKARVQCQNPSNTKRTYLICDTPAERWSRRYVDVRARHGRAAIQPEAMTFKAAFVCFGIGVMLAASRMKDHWKRLFCVRVEMLAKGPGCVKTSVELES